MLKDNQDQYGVRFRIEREARRIEREINFVWAQKNPEMFTDSVMAFQRDYPTLEWQHFVDLSRTGYLTLIAKRRPKPYGSESQYLLGSWLEETGFSD